MKTINPDRVADAHTLLRTATEAVGQLALRYPNHQFPPAHEVEMHDLGAETFRHAVALLDFALEACREADLVEQPADAGAGFDETIHRIWAPIEDEPAVIAQRLADRLRHDAAGGVA